MKYIGVTAVHSWLFWLVLWAFFGPESFGNWIGTIYKAILQ